MSVPSTRAHDPETVYLKGYRAPAFRIERIDLVFNLAERDTQVNATMNVRRASGTDKNIPLILDGHGFQLNSVAVNRRILEKAEYEVNDEHLTISNVGDECVVEIVTTLQPQDNTSLEGLYKSSGNFCTQCEAEGFRTITYFLDRPDVLARYTTTISADKAKYPVLLSNGNLIARGEGINGAHWAKWEDPFPKPSYLFAMVAGDLARVEDEFITRSQRRVKLKLFVQHHNAGQCEHALRSLKKAMRWDEETFGREYDLDIYMIVAVDDFNMGAMENKGLNVFNSRYVLAEPKTATDSDYQAIEGIIGHEYFHNWSGNRVTCRDWFQLSLKEGFTVFRDQEFSADMNSRAVKRIADVNLLRTHQFREDAGPLAHPVRPEHYVQINNFYTMTVYNKGAELIRMMHTLLGREKFRAGTDLYFTRHDGQAVTTDDFVHALQDASGIDLTQFQRWYGQAGTPELYVTSQYDAAARTYALTFRQHCPATPGQPNKEPFAIPIAMGLLGPNGLDLPLQLAHDSHPVESTRVLVLRETIQTFTFINVASKPIPSLLRGFSAPVKLHIELGDAERCSLMAHDSDLFNRWEASYQLAAKIILDLVKRIQSGAELTLEPLYVDAVRRMLLDMQLDPAFVSHALSLPSETYLSEFMTVIDPDAIHVACRYLRRVLAEKLESTWMSVYERTQENGTFSIDAESIGRRGLKNTALSYLMELNSVDHRKRCIAQFRNASNMTDVVSALVLLVNAEGAEGNVALRDFYERWKNDPLVLDKWFSIQAACRLPGTLDNVIALTRHPSFNVSNPNRLRALIGVFAHGNAVRFHDPSGAGYALVADYVLELNKRNPQVAARLVTALTQWRRYGAGRQALMRAQLERLRDAEHLSKDVYEIVITSLA